MAPPKRDVKSKQNNGEKRKHIRGGVLRHTMSNEKDSPPTHGSTPSVRGSPVKRSTLLRNGRSESIKEFINPSTEEDNLTEVGEGGHEEEWMQGGKPLVKPDDQLQLSEAEMKEEITRILQANNPHAPQNIVRYSFKDSTFKQIASIDQLAIHFSLDGNLIHKESDEARRQLKRLEGQETASELGTDEKEEVQEEGDDIDREDDDVSTNEPQKESGTEEKESSSQTSRGKKPANQFNYSERASQTYNNPLRERGTATDPPPRLTYSGSVTQWQIFDAYKDDFEKQKRGKGTPILSGALKALRLQEKIKEKKAMPGRKEDEVGRKGRKAQLNDSSTDDIARVTDAARIIERMVNQNTFDDVSQDFKYYEDVSDDFRDQEGTLLPLWKFTHDKAKKLAITSLCWNPTYADMFAVGHGSYDFMKQSSGMILLYSLKNPSYPEYVYETESGVTSLDAHPDHPSLLCVGFYDGSVSVYNMTTKTTDSQSNYRSTAKNGKHTDPVWQVRWQKDDLDNNLNFFSISSDGRITEWTLIKNELHYHDIIKLVQVEEVKDDPIDELTTAAIAPTPAGGTTFDFHKEKDYLFLVGTEEGQLHACSKAYSSTFLETYTAHHMAVYKVEWNYYHTNIFITCSADWTVKIWERSSSKKEPVFTYDLNSAVGDIAWSPYSSTVFAAVTADGKVHVFDLNINKYEAICEQLVTPKKKTKLTHIAFNPKYPIIIVGDDRGYVTSLKLSPNLRKMPKEKKNLATSTMSAAAMAQKLLDDAEKKKESEIAKLEKLLTMVRSPEKDPSRETGVTEGS